MAILDRRLVPLVELLTEIGMDWLAFELMEGIERGQEPIENEDALALAREQARRNRIEKVVRVPSENVVGKPILGDKQLEWVADHVYERLEATIAQMLASLDALDELVASDRKREGEIAEPIAVSVVLDTEEDRAVSRIEAAEAQAHLGALRQSLDSWLENALSDIDQ